MPPLLRPKLPRPFSAKRAFFDKIAALKQAKEMREAEERKLAKKKQDEKKQRLKELQKQIKDSKKKQIRITKKISKNYRPSSFKFFISEKFWAVFWICKSQDSGNQEKNKSRSTKKRVRTTSGAKTNKSHFSTRQSM